MGVSSLTKRGGRALLFVGTLLLLLLWVSQVSSASRNVKKTKGLKAIRDLVQKGNLAAALVEIEDVKLRASSKRNPELWLIEAKIHSAQGHANKAILVLEEGLALFKGKSEQQLSQLNWSPQVKAELHFELAKVLNRERKMAGGLSKIERSQQLTARNVISHFHSALAMKNGLAEEKEVQAWTALALIYNGLNDLDKDWSMEDVHFLSRMPEVFPHNEELYVQAAKIAAHYGDHEEALRLLNLAEAAKKVVITDKANVLLKLERYQAVIDYLKPILEHSKGKFSFSERENWFKLLMDAHLRLDQLDQGIKVGDECIKQYPNATMCYFGRGVIRVHSSDPGRGQEDQKKVWEILASGYPPAQGCEKWSVYSEWSNPPPYNGIRIVDLPMRGGAQYGQAEPYILPDGPSLPQGLHIRTRYFEKEAVIAVMNDVVVERDVKVVRKNYIDPSKAPKSEGERQANGNCVFFAANYPFAVFPYFLRDVAQHNANNLEVKRVKRAAIFHWLDANYYHFLMEIVPKIVILEEHLSQTSEEGNTEPVKYFLERSKFIERAAEEFGFKDQVMWYEGKTTRYVVDELYIVDWKDAPNRPETPFLPPPLALEKMRKRFVFNDSSSQPDATVRENNNSMALDERGSSDLENFVAMTGTERNLVLYVSRPPNLARSCDSLEAETLMLEDLHRLVEEDQRFIDLGLKFVIHYGSENFTEQLRLFKSGVIVLGPHGAGLSNLIFARPKTHVIEFPLSIERAFFSQLAASLDLNYWVIPNLVSNPWSQYKLTNEARNTVLETVEHILQKMKSERRSRTAI